MASNKSKDLKKLYPSVQGQVTRSKARENYVHAQGLEQITTLSPMAGAKLKNGSKLQSSGQGQVPSSRTGANYNFLYARNYFRFRAFGVLFFVVLQQSPSQI